MKNFSKRLTPEEEAELQTLIGEYVNERIANLTIEWALRVCDDDSLPHWMKVAHNQIFSAPSPLMDLIRRLDMGRDEVESLKNIEEWTV